MNHVSSLNLDRFRPQDQWSGPSGALDVLTMVRRVDNAIRDLVGAGLSRLSSCNSDIVAGGCLVATGVGGPKGCEEHTDGVVSESAGAQGCENDSLKVHFIESSRY